MTLPHDSGSNDNVSGPQLLHLFLRIPLASIKSTLQQELEYIQDSDTYDRYGFSIDSLPKLSAVVEDDLLDGISVFAIAIVLFRHKIVSWNRGAQIVSGDPSTPQVFGLQTKQEINHLAAQIRAAKGIVLPEVDLSGKGILKNVLRVGMNARRG